MLEQLHKLTPMEDSFGINMVALVDGQPRTPGPEGPAALLRRFPHRGRPATHRVPADQAQGSAPPRRGLLIAILDIDEVIQLIRSSDDASAARTRLIDVFDLSEAQANYILELQLRRLTKFSRIELEGERDDLQRQIEELEAILADENCCTAPFPASWPTSPGPMALRAAHRASGVGRCAGRRRHPLEVSDDPCWVLLSSTGMLARTGSGDAVPVDGPRVKHDAIVGAVRTTARGEFAVVTSTGRMVRLSALELPTLPPLGSAPGLSGGAQSRHTST